MTTPYEKTDVAENLKDLEHALRIAGDDRERLCILYDVGVLISQIPNARYAQLSKDHFHNLGVDAYDLSPKDVGDHLGEGIAKGRRQAEEQSAENRALDSKAIAVEGKKVWPDPCPLPEALLPVAPFDFDLLPEQLRSWGADIAERMQCPRNQAEEQR
jgi:hypothetical protein